MLVPITEMHKKSEMRNRMGQEYLDMLLMSIKNEVLHAIDFKQLILNLRRSSSVTAVGRGYCLNIDGFFNGLILNNIFMARLHRAYILYPL